MRGKLLVIEGTDCSGKETQSKKLVERLTNEGIKIVRLSFPMYESPTGKIVGGCYLGKKHICDGFFEEPTAVDPKVASLYYAADRKYNIDIINDYLDKGINVLLDRYIESNMAHQGGKIKVKEERLKMYKWLEKLEYDLLELPKPDMTMFLYMPYESALKLRLGRKEAADKHESVKEHLLDAEASYLELADIYEFKKIDCVYNNEIRTITDISNEVYDVVKSNIKLSK